MSLVNRYPDGDYGPLAERIANLHGIKPEQLTLGAGSREILRMAAASYLHGSKKLILASPSFEPIASFARAARAEVIAVTLNRRYEHDLNAMLAHSDASTGLIYICNPNNPTGSLTPRKDIEVFLGKVPSTAMVVIDEAYHEYVAKSMDYVSFLDRPIDDPRVIVLRTFSKVYGLAGLRVGYAVSAPQVSRQLSAMCLQWGVNVVGARAATAALDDPEFVSLSAKRNTDDRQEFYNQANGRMLRWIDSHTNFVMLNGGLPPQKIAEHYRKNNVLLGPLVPQMPKYVRVSIGKTEEMHEFWRVWDLLPPHPMAM